MSENPLLSLDFRIPFDAINASHIIPAVRAHLEDARRRMKLIEEDSSVTFESTFGAFDRMTEGLERAMSIAGHLEAVATTPAIRDAYSAVQPEVSQFSTGIYLSAPLYRAMRAFAESDDAARVTGARKRFMETTLADFRRAGAELDDEGKKRLAQIDVERRPVGTDRIHE
jgi:oligopeptidase A